MGDIECRGADTADTRAPVRLGQRQLFIKLLVLDQTLGYVIHSCLWEGGLPILSGFRCWSLGSGLTLLCCPSTNSTELVLHCLERSRVLSYPGCWAGSAGCAQIPAMGALNWGLQLWRGVPRTERGCGSVCRSAV